LIMSRRSRLVAAITRTLTMRPLPSAPTFCNSPVSRNRKSRPCIRSVISPTSSRKIVPMWAVSSFPGLSRYAPVKLPFTCPKSSDSSSVSGRPAQLTGANTWLARGPREWIARATISLPTPLSPVIRTFASERATRSISCSSAVTSALRPVSWTCVRGRTAPIGLTRVLLVLLSATPSIIVHEPFYESPVFLCHAHKRSPDAISRTGLRRRGNPLHLNVRRKGGAREREAQTASRTGVQHASGLQQDTCGADVDHTHTHVGGEVCEFTADLMPWGPSPLFHPSTHSSQRSSSWIHAHLDELSNVGLQVSRQAGADVCLPRELVYYQ